MFNRTSNNEVLGLLGVSFLITMVKIGEASFVTVVFNEGNWGFLGAIGVTAGFAGGFFGKFAKEVLTI